MEHPLFPLSWEAVELWTELDALHQLGHLAVKNPRLEDSNNILHFPLIQDLLRGFGSTSAIQGFSQKKRKKRRAATTATTKTPLYVYI